MNIVVPNPAFLGMAYAIGIVTMLLAGLAMRKWLRIGSLASWILFVFIAPTPLLFSITVAGLTGVPTNAALPAMAMASILGMVMAHFILPALAPDFQTDGWMTSCVIGFLLGIIMIATGMGMKVFDSVMPNQADAFGNEKITWDESKVIDQTQK